MIMNFENTYDLICVFPLPEPSQSPILTMAEINSTLENSRDQEDLRGADGLMRGILSEEGSLASIS
jgi:hypothetical protein